MIESVTRTNDYQFEPVHADWSGLRTQMTIGLLAIFCLCLINFIPFCPRNFFTPANSSFIDFTLYFASCSAVALITLKIGGIFGNRNGAGCAIWSALIFAVYPWQAHFFSSPIVKTSRVISFFILLSVFILLRAKQTKRKVLLFLIFLPLALLSSVLRNGNLANSFPSLDQLLLAGCAMAGLILCSRLIVHALSWQVAGKIVLCLLCAVACREIVACPTLIILAVAVLAITLSLACLPGTGAAPARTNALLGYLGLIVLILIATIFEWAYITFQTELIHLWPWQIK